jgi:F-box protein 11
MVNTNVITVSKGAFSRFKTITEAIQLAEPGTKILVEPGLYHESVIIDKKIELVGNGSVGKIILYSEELYTVKMKTKHATVRGITIKQGGKVEENTYPNAVDIPTGSAIFENCVISSDTGNGFRIFERNTSPIIQDCIIHDAKKAGIFITHEADPILIGCQVYNNQRQGLWIQEKANGTIENCEIHSNQKENVVITDEAAPFFKRCKIFNGQSQGVWIQINALGSFENCEIHSNRKLNVGITHESDPSFKQCKIHNSQSHGIWVQTNGRGTIEDCEIHSNKGSNVGITHEAEPVIMGCNIHSGQSHGVWVQENGRGTIENCKVHDHAECNIQLNSEANPVIRNCYISNSKSSGIWVGTKSRGLIENCDIASNKNTNVVIANEADPVIRGCNVFSSSNSGIWVTKHARGTIEDCKVYYNDAYNMEIDDEANPLLRRCEFFKSDEAGIWVSENGRGIFEDCEIFESKHANIEIDTGADPIFRNCKISFSDQSGISISEKGKGNFENCEIYSNAYSNVNVEKDSDPEFLDCKIYKSERYGILVSENGLGTMENCEIYSNTFANIKIDQESDPVIRGCKIYDSKDTGLLVIDRGRGTIEDCEIYQNSNEDILVSEDSKLKILDSSKMPEEEKEKETNHETPSSDPSETTEEVLKELYSLIGMENIKQEIQKTIEYIQFNKELANFGVETEQVEITASHTVLFGNPGTGKTTVAQILGKLYKAMGLLPSGHVVQVNREKLVGEYIGHTAPKTRKKIDEAIGGVLFIDEAYALTNKGSESDFGPEAIEVLLEEMENRRGEFVVIVAGYENEMMNFLAANPGLQSRFTQYFHLQDYTPDELLAIARKMVLDKKRKLSSDAEELLYKQFTALWRRRDKFFSNARTVRNYVDSMMVAQAQRCMRVSKEQWTKAFLVTLTVEDVEAVLPKDETKEFKLPINEEMLSEALNQLHRMIGMDQVKKEIEKLATLVRFYKEEGRDLTDLSTHTLLIGSPGTGKTEVARIIAKIYQALGILERGDLIEVKRDNLVSGNAGESEQLTAFYIDQAMGGTLFIDEAYQLTQYGAQDPGHKVIEVLLKRMEDDRGKFIVIAAGYKGKMEQFLDSNDGLRRRFAHTIEFEDYTPDELMEISELFLQEKGYTLDIEAYRSLLTFFQTKYENRDHTFGNAGFARNTVNELIKNLDYRMARTPKEERNRESMRTVLPIDMENVIIF